MTASVSRLESKHISQLDMLKQTAPRRNLLAELADIKKQLKDSHMDDPLSLKIADWQKKFVNAVMTCKDLEKLEEIGLQYITLMQELLRDAVRGVPLDERALLGSDGRTYSFMSYNLYLHSAPEELRGRSPFNPLSSAKFTTSPHHNAAYMIKWLQKHNAQLNSEELETQYAQMMQDQPIELPETETKSGPVMQARAISAARDSQSAVSMPDEKRRERLRRIVEKRARRIQQEEEENRAITEQLEIVSSRIKQVVRESFEPIHTSVAAVGQRVFARADEIKRMDDERMEALSREVDRLNSEIEELESRNRELERMIASVSSEISEAKKDDLRLERDINATRIAIKKMQQKSRNSLLTSLALIGVCAFATWALSGVAAVSASHNSSSTMLNIKVFL